MGRFGVARPPFATLAAPTLRPLPKGGSSKTRSQSVTTSLLQCSANLCRSRVTRIARNAQQNLCHFRVLRVRARTWPARHPCSPSQPAPPATTAPATALLGSSYLSRAPPQQQPQNSRSVPDQCRQRQVDVLAIPHKLRQAGAATGMAHRLQPDVMAVMLAMVRNLGAQPVAHQRRREKPPSWPSEQL